MSSSLYTYCIPHDDGAAPNPFWGICTLTICKPKIRKKAKIGDWVVGIGSKNSPIGDKSKHVVYAMKITDKMTMCDYDLFCKTKYPEKLPDLRHKNWKRHKGDCIYDFSTNPSKIRKSVHDERNRKVDLSGKYALVSNHFYYFGDKPVKLPADLYPIIKNGRGHKSKYNDSYFNKFMVWIRDLDLEINKIYGKPQKRRLLTAEKCGTGHVKIKRIC